MKFGKLFAILMLASLFSMPLKAVTEKEMEEARTITAKAYLRYANDGSGYLDDVTAKTMAELTSKLKAKEKENIKAFNSVKVPADYSSWDKEKLVEFWSVTFFTSPALEQKGKVARARVKKQINAMTISAPVKEEPKKEEPKKEEPKEEVKVEEQPTATPEATETPIEQPTAAEVADTQEEILSDQQAIEKDAEESGRTTPVEQSHTWVYVLVLAILIGIVIWLVVYAANLMKRQPSGDDFEDNNDNDTANLRAQARKAIATKNEELEAVRKSLREEEDKNSTLGMEIERLKLDLSRMEIQLSQLREENIRLKKTNNRRATTDTAEEAPAPKDKLSKENPSQPILNVIYLGRANARGIFVRADRRINPGNTIYRLDTNDGLVGTFHVVDNPDVIDVALSAPDNYLANGCVGDELDDTTGVSRIITESAGTAIFENGYWKVLRKTRIRYE